jgi:hypothetical protein
LAGVFEYRIFGQEQRSREKPTFASVLIPSRLRFLPPLQCRLESGRTASPSCAVHVNADPGVALNRIGIADRDPIDEGNRYDNPSRDSPGRPRAATLTDRHTAGNRVDRRRPHAVALETGDGSGHSHHARRRDDDRRDSHTAANGGVDLGVYSWPWVSSTSSGAASVETDFTDYVHGIDNTTLDELGIYSFQYTVRVEGDAARVSDFHFAGKGQHHLFGAGCAAVIGLFRSRHREELRLTFPVLPLDCSWRCGRPA